MTTYTPFFFAWPSIIDSLYPGADTVTAMILGGLTITLTSVPMLLLAVCTPRAGANYVTLSRGLHPLFGMFESWTRIVQMPLINGIIAYFGAQFISTSILIMGKILGSPELTSLGNFLGTFQMLIVVALIANVISGIICIRGVHLLSYVMVGSAIITTISVLIMIFLFATSNAQAGWDATWGTGAYNEIVNVATKNGWSTHPASLNATWPAVLSVAGYIFPNNIMPLAGEVSKPKRSFMLSFIGSGIFLTVLSAVLTGVQFACYGSFINKYTYVIWNGYASQLTLNPTVQPNLILFSSVLTRNPIMLIMMGPVIGIMAGIINIPTGYYWFERPFFAMAFDHFGPEALAKVHPRWHTPYWGVILCLILSLIFTVGIAFIPYLSSVSFFIANGIAALWWSFAATVLPYFRPSIYRVGFQWSIKKVSVMTIIGALSAAWGMYILFAGLTGVDPGSIVINVLTYLAAMIYFVYYLNRAYGKGLDVDKIFLTVPPE
jgi:amino acid transporter